MQPLTNPNSVCTTLYELCLDYQTYLEKQLENGLNGDYSIDYRYSDYAIEHLYDGQMKKKPTKLIAVVVQEDINEKKLQRIQQITKNYDIIEKLRCSLIDHPLDLIREPEQKLRDFNAIFSDEETKNNLKAHSDSPTMRFFKNVAYLLTSVFFGAGLAISMRNKKSYAFWKSQGEITLNEMERLLESVNDASNQNQIMFQ